MNALLVTTEVQLRQAWRDLYGPHATPPAALFRRDNWRSGAEAARSRLRREARRVSRYAAEASTVTAPWVVAVCLPLSPPAEVVQARTKASALKALHAARAKSDAPTSIVLLPQYEWSRIWRGWYHRTNSLLPTTQNELAAFCDVMRVKERKERK